MTGADAGEGPVRPSISPLLWCGAAVWAASAAGTEAALCSWTGQGWVSWVAWSAAAGLAVVATFGRRGTWRVVAFALAVGLVTSLSHASWMTSRARAAEEAGVAAVAGVVCADARTGVFGTTLPLRLEGGPLAGLVVSLTWPEGEPVPAYGRLVRVRARLRTVDRASPALRPLFRSGEIVRALPLSAEAGEWAPPPLGPVASWRADALAALGGIGGEGADVVAAMVLGARAPVDGERVQEDSRAAGVAWALTASGLHAGVAVLLAERLAGLLGGRRRARTTAALLTLAAFVLAAGLRVSLVRAAVVAAVSAGARLSGRRRDGTAALGAAIVAIVALDPTAAFDVGMMLGCLAVGGIVVFGPLAGAWLVPLAGRRASWALGGSCAAQASVSAVSVALFGSVSPYGPLALAASAPAVQCAVMLGLAGASVLPVSGLAARALLALAAAAASAAVAVWRAVASWPGAVLPMAAVPWWGWCAWAGVPVALWLRWPLPRRSARTRLVAVLAAVSVAGCAVLPSPVPAAVIVLDVGQGDAVVIRDGGSAILVDVGPDAASLRRALARCSPSTVDGIVLTHAHEDHIGGLPGLAGVLRPMWIAVPRVDDEAVARLATACARRAGTVVALARGMAWSVGRTRVRVLWPDAGTPGLEANDTSVILLVERGDTRVILLGDAEERAQRGALRAYEGDADAVKVSHHGSANGNVKAAYAAWRPRVALISVGARNRFGHPTRSALSTIQEAGAEVRRTDLSGDLVFPLEGPSPSSPPGDGGASAPDGPSAPALCDNRRVPDDSSSARVRSVSEVPQWPTPTCRTSSPSISSTARRSCCSSAPSSGFASGSPAWPTSTSISRRSTASRSTPTGSSTQPTPCRS